MTFQYALRFESGERRGEVIPISIVAAQGGVFTIGRKPGNSLQVTDASVSGRHAELEVEGDHVSIRDLESTNGTEVGGRRVRQSAVGHGDEFTLGKVEFTLIDQLRASASIRAASAAAVDLPPVEGPEGLAETRIQPRDEAIEISAADLERSKRKSKLAPLGLGALVLLSGGAYWWSTREAGTAGDDGRRRAAAPVESPAGNLIRAGYSFESETGWVFDEEDVGGFDFVRGAAASGERGARVELDGGGSATLLHEPVSTKGAVRLSGLVRTQELGIARLGLRFTNVSGDVSVTVWSDPVKDTAEEFVDVGLIANPPTGLGRVQVVLEATVDPTAKLVSEGDDAVPVHVVDIDDVALVGESEISALHEFASWRVTPLAKGQGSGELRSLSIASLDRLMVPSIRYAGGGSAGSPLSLSTEVRGNEFVVTPSVAGEATVQVRVSALLVADGLATIGAASSEGASTYASHGQTFERKGATSLLVGADATLVRFRFDGPMDISSRAFGDDVVIEGRTSEAQPMTVQLDFTDERALAQRLARRARDERRSGENGTALRTWNEMLRDVPFEAALINEAAVEQNAISAEGRAELKALTGEVERARFFGLEGLYQQRLAKVVDLEERYRGSDVEAPARALADLIRTELASLGGDGVRDESVRLEAIGTVLEKNDAPALKAQVDAYRKRMTTPPDSNESMKKDSDS